MSDFEYEDEYEYENDESSVEIENVFYTAEDDMAADPARALRQFLQVVELDGGSTLWSVRALTRCVQLELRLRLEDEALQHFRSLLAVPVNKSEVNEAVSQLLSTLSDFTTSAGPIVRIYRVAMDALASNRRVWFSTGIRLLRFLVKIGDFTDFPQVADELFHSLIGPDSVVTNSVRFLATNLPQDQISGYLDLLALVLAVERDRTLAKRLYDDVVRKTVDSGVVDVRTVAALKSVGGEVALLSRQYRQAYEIFLEAFKAYQEAGDAGKAKQMLKLVVLCNLLSESNINPFDTREAKALLLADKEIAVYGEMKSHFDRDNLDALIQAAKLVAPAAGDQSSRMVDKILDLKRARLVEKMLTSGAVLSVRVDFLAMKMTCTADDMRKILLRLILAGRVSGKLEHGNFFRAEAPASVDLVREWALVLQKHQVALSS